MSNENALKFFAEKKLDAPGFISVETHPGVIHLVDSGTGSKTLVFIHGSPGSWSAYIEYFSNQELNSVARIIAVDRPGFGQSEPGKAVPSLQEQARRIKIALEKPGDIDKVYLIGHSLGGPVAVRMAIDYPDFVAGLILIAPSMDPELEKMRWFNTLAYYPPVKWVLPVDWLMSNEEIVPHKQELQQLAGELGKIVTPVIVIQGLADDLVPPQNTRYIERQFSAADPLIVQCLEGLNHFIPWSRPDLVVDAALKLLHDR